MIGLLLVEDNTKLRSALGSGLEATGEVKVIFACASGEEALEYCWEISQQAFPQPIQRRLLLSLLHRLFK